MFFHCTFKISAWYDLYIEIISEDFADRFGGHSNFHTCHIVVQGKCLLKYEGKWSKGWKLFAAAVPQMGHKDLFSSF